MTRFFRARGSNASDASSQAIVWVGQTPQRQIDLLAYIDVFWLLMLVGAILIPVALIIRPIDLKALARGH
jgi:DHA2 family multidrug resistance protein